MSTLNPLVNTNQTVESSYSYNHLLSRQSHSGQSRDQPCVRAQSSRMDPEAQLKRVSIGHVSPSPLTLAHHLLAPAQFCRRRCRPSPLRRHWAHVTRADRDDRPCHFLASSRQSAESLLFFLHIAGQIVLVFFL